MTVRLCWRSGLALLTLLLVAALPVRAEDADLATVVAALEKGYAQLSDLQADFSQVATISSIKKEQRGSGELLIRRPADGTAQFRFNYHKPKQKIVSDGKKVWFYLPENRQVITTSVDTLFKGGNSVALTYLTGLGHVSRDFTVTFAGDGRDKKGNYTLELVPKQPTPVMAKLRLTIAASAVTAYRESGAAAEPFPVLGSVVIDAGGNRTSFEFSKVKTNRGIGSSQFTFKIPAGTEVIQQ